MINFNNRKAEKWFDRYIRNSYTEIKVKSGKCRYNFRCQMNAVHEAIKAEQPEIAMILCIDSYSTFIHFVNVKNGKYTDNTLGVWIDDYKCYLVRHIEEKDYRKINDVFTEYRKHIRGKLPLWLKLTSDITL